MKKFKWTIKQQRALKDSHKKWIDIVKGEESDAGMDNCKCCEYYALPILFNNDDNKKKKNKDEPCAKCPISQYSGKPNCLDTPYGFWKQNAEVVFIEDKFRRIPEGEFGIPAAKAEADFIKKVLKAGT